MPISLLVGSEGTVAASGNLHTDLTKLADCSDTKPNKIPECAVNRMGKGSC